MVQAIDVLGYEGADRAGVLQCGERVVCWVWKGATDGQESDVCTKPGKRHEMYSPSPYMRGRYIPVSLPGDIHVNNELIELVRRTAIPKRVSSGAILDELMVLDT